MPQHVTICEGKVKGKDPDALRSESKRYLLGASKIVNNRQRSEHKVNKGEIQSWSSENRQGSKPGNPINIPQKPEDKNYNKRRG